MDTTAHYLEIPGFVVLASAAFILWTVVKLVTGVGRQRALEEGIKRRELERYERHLEKRDAYLRGVDIPPGHYGVICLLTDSGEGDNPSVGCRVVSTFARVAEELERWEDRPGVELLVVDSDRQLICGGDAAAGPDVFPLDALVR